MAQTNDDTLEQRLLDLESGLRAVRTTNPFGLVAAEIVLDPAGPGQFSILKGDYDNGTTVATGPRTVPEGPWVDLYVGSGRLRVDVSSSVNPVGGALVEAYIGHRVWGPAVTQADLDAAPVVSSFSTSEAFMVQVPNATGASSVRGVGGNFGIRADLTPAWYRARAVFGSSYPTAAAATAGGWFWGCRIAAMPY